MLCPLSDYIKFIKMEKKNKKQKTTTNKKKSTRALVNTGHRHYAIPILNIYALIRNLSGVVGGAKVLGKLPY